MHNKDSENSEPEQIKEYINCFNFVYIQRLALSTNGKVGVCEFVLCEMVRGLSIKSGKCIAKNDFFADRLCLSEVQISRIIKSLCGLGLLENQRKKYGWERMVTEKYYQIVKHEKKHLSLREYEKAGLKIVAPTEPRQPEKKPRAAKTAANRTEKSEPEPTTAAPTFAQSCIHSLNLPQKQAVELAHRLALKFRLPNDEVVLKCVAGFSVWAARENITLLNNDNLSEIVDTYFEYIIAKNSEKNG